MNPAPSILQRTKTGLKPPFRTSIRHSTFGIRRSSTPLSPQTPSHPVSTPRPGPTRPGPLKSNFLAVITLVPKTAITVGPKETWQAEKVSIWQAGMHDNPLGQRLTALMISKRLADSAVPMSLLADHPNVQFNYYRGGLGSCAVEMH